jgi:uncharacterized protein (TIGR00645 family)
MDDNHAPPAHSPMVRWMRFIPLIERFVFAIRWMLVPLYLGLVVALALYIAHFTHEVFEMALHMGENTQKQDILMLFILELVDMTMISQLVVMTIQGGYAIFIRPLTGELGNLPQWLKHGLGTSEQKIKLGMSIMGIMMVQLLKNFIGLTEAHSLTAEQLWQREVMLGWIMAATLMFCVFNILMHPAMLRKGANDDHQDESHEV